MKKIHEAAIEAGLLEITIEAKTSIPHLKRVGYTHSNREVLENFAEKYNLRLMIAGLWNGIYHLYSTQGKTQYIINRGYTYAE